MMIRTAGGPGSVSPLDFNARKRPLPMGTWVAIGIVAAAHLAVGVGLYYQRFELEIPPVVEEPPVKGLFLDLPRPKPPEPAKAVKAPQPPNVVRPTPAPTRPTETIAASTTNTPTDSTTISVTRTIDDPTPDATPLPEPVRPQPPAVIRNPSWERQPSGEQMMRAYPQRAIAAEVSGRATLNCAVLVSGAVSDCNVTGEDPAGYGFGRAAQSLSRYFKVNPRTVNGAAVDARVIINLRFNLPD